MELHNCKLNSNCKYLLSTIFTLIGLLVVTSGWGVSYATQAKDAAYEVEKKLDSREAQYDYIIKTLDGIKIEQQNQRRLLEKIFTKTSADDTN
jgi:hypothetical protein